MTKEENEKLTSQVWAHYHGYEKGYNDALDDVDNIITEQIDKSDNQVECQTLRWVLDVLSDLIKY